MILEAWMRVSSMERTERKLHGGRKTVQQSSSWAYPGNKDINKYGIERLEYIRCLMRMNKRMYVNRNWKKVWKEQWLAVKF